MAVHVCHERHLQRYQFVLLFALLNTFDLMAQSAALIVPALKKPTATVIIAHGLGDRWDFLSQKN